MALRAVLAAEVVAPATPPGPPAGPAAQAGSPADRGAEALIHGELRRCVEVRGGAAQVRGGALLVWFDGTAEAIGCAVAMRDAASAAGYGLRAGLDAGETAGPDDPPGPDDAARATLAAVASELCAQAEGGEILVSGLVCALAGTRLDLPATPRGPVAVAGLAEPAQAWSIGPYPGGQRQPQRIRVAIVDDQRLVRRGLQVIVDAEPDLEVAGEAADGDEAVDVVSRLRPDVVLMDIRMPRVNGLDAAKAILDRASARVLILTTFDADEYVYRALRMGASGFLLKDAPPQRLLTAIRCAHSGEALIDPAITGRLIRAFARPPGPPLPDLTGRETEVLRLMARGLSNSEIAGSLWVGESTVKTHVARILAKLGARDRVQAVVRAFESGLAGAPD